MNVTLRLFGAFRQYDASGQVQLELPTAARVADLRSALDAYGRAHWSGFKPELLRVSAFASADEVLRDAEPLPADGELAILPPVSGG